MKEGSKDGKTISLERKDGRKLDGEKGIMKWSKKAGEPF